MAFYSVIGLRGQLRTEGDGLHVRTLFVVKPELEGSVRQRIETALSTQRLVGPGEAVTTWRLSNSQSASVLPGERVEVDQLLRS